jgi:hypothetical protein
MKSLTFYVLIVFARCMILWVGYEFVTDAMYKAFNPDL